jgi:hypothetical protein
MNGPQDHLGSNLGHGSDVRCKTAFLPKAEVRPRSCYVAQVPQTDSGCGLRVGLGLHRLIRLPYLVQLPFLFEAP